VKTNLLLAGVLFASTPIQAADLGSSDLPRIHAEYKANQARWAREFLDKSFAATMTIGGISVRVKAVAWPLLENLETDKGVAAPL